MRAAVSALVLILALPLYACAQSLSSPAIYAHPTLTPAAGPLMITQFLPPAEYARWYANMESCLGLDGQYAAVRWFVVPSPWKGSDQVRGLTHGAYIGSHRIIVNAQEWSDSVLVEHEAIHHILDTQGLSGKESHEMPYFDGTCGAELYTPVDAR